MNSKFFSQKIIVGLILLLVVIGSSISTSLNGGDFDVYLDAARKLSEGKNIYQPPFIKDLQYYYSVFFALLLIPFSFNVFIAEVLWSLLSYFLLYRTFKLIEAYFDFTLLNKKQYNLWLLLTLILSIQFIMYNVAMIQVTFFVVWAIFESLEFIFKGKNMLGGIILALAINIKIMPVLLLPYLFYRGYFKAFFITILTFVILLFLPAIFIGNNYNQFLLSEWWAIINPVNKEHMFETGIGTHSLVALLPVYLTETIGEMSYKRNILNLTHHHTEVVLNIFRLFILSLSILYLRTIPFIKEKGKLKSYWEISFFVLIIPLLLPHQQKYAFLLAVPMASYLIYFFIATFPYQKTVGYYFALYTFVICMLIYSPLYGSDSIGKFLFLYTQHYRFMTFSTLLIIPVSLYCSPNKLQTIMAMSCKLVDKPARINPGII